MKSSLSPGSSRINSPTGLVWIRVIVFGSLIVIFGNSSWITLLINVHNIYYKNAIVQSFQKETIGPWNSISSDISFNLAVNRRFNENLEKRDAWLMDLANTQILPLYLNGIFEIVLQDNKSAIKDLKEYSSNNYARKELSNYFLGVAFELDGYQDRAIGIWNQSPEISHSFLRIGTEELFNQANYKAALKQFLVAGAIDPSSCEPLYRLAQTWLEIGEPRTAFLILEDSKSKDCTNSMSGEIHYLGGKILAESGEVEKAIQELRKAVELDRGDAKKLSLLGNLLAQTDPNSEEAYSLYKEAQAVAPENIWNYLNLCNFERHRNSFAEALFWCQSAIDKFPGMATSYHSLGLVYLDMQDFDEAISWFNEAIGHDDKNVNTWNRLGDAYHGLGEIDLALQAYSQALKIDPENNYALERRNVLKNRQ